MSILSRILQKIVGLTSHTAPLPGAHEGPHEPHESSSTDRPRDRPARPVERTSPLHVGAALVAKAQRMGGNLDPLGSVVDLLETIEEPSSLKARAALADEFSPGRPFTGSASDNVWLTGELLRRLAEPRNQWRLDDRG